MSITRTLQYYEDITLYSQRLFVAVLCGVIAYALFLLTAKWLAKLFGGDDSPPSSVLLAESDVQRYRRIAIEVAAEQFIDAKKLPPGVINVALVAPGPQTFLCLCRSGIGIPIELKDWVVSDPENPGYYYPVKPETFDSLYNRMP